MYRASAPILLGLSILSHLPGVLQGIPTKEIVFKPSFSFATDPIKLVFLDLNVYVWPSAKLIFKQNVRKRIKVMIFY